MKQLESEALQSLHVLLQQMNACAQELETTTQHEYEAIRSLQAEQILSLSERRISIFQCLTQLEEDCRRQLGSHGIPDELSLESVIEMYAGERAADYQALRRNLYERFMNIDKRSQENRLRMHAAYNVSSTILQHLGLSSVKQTYDRRTMR